MDYKNKTADAEPFFDDSEDERATVTRLNKQRHNQEEDRRKQREWETGSTLIRASELEYRREDEIARGNYGTVYKGRCRGYPVAIKVLHNQQLTQQKIEELKREVEIMKALRHPCILLLMGVCTEKDNLAVVMEYVEGRDLGSIVHDRSIPISNRQRFHIAKGIAQGMNWLHCLKPEPIIHRDLKPPNVLITREGNVKVCDFGLSCAKEKFDPKGPLKDKAVGTPVYMAPEILCGIPASEKSDVYAYGMLLWELFARQGKPFAHMNSFQLFCETVVDRDERPPIPDSVPDNVVKLIRDCWLKDRYARPSFAEILTRWDDIIVDNTIRDVAGRVLWKRLHALDAEHLPWMVEWDNFILAFGEHMNMKPTALSPNSTMIQCAKLILAVASKDITTSDTNKRFAVTLESYARFLHIFGPLRPTILSDFDELCKAGCFHGLIDSKEAERRLASMKKGFLLRVSANNDTCVTISRKTAEGYKHQRIAKKPNGFNVQIGKEVYSFPSLIDFLMSPQAKERTKKGGLHLTKVCNKDSPFAAVHHDVPLDRSNYEPSPLLQVSKSLDELSIDT